MATSVIPFPRRSARTERRQVERDPACHGIDFALELQIAERSGEFVRARDAAPRRGRIARAFAWFHTLPFVGSRD